MTSPVRELSRRGFVVKIALGTGAVWLHSRALAHAGLVKAEPARRVVLRKAPRQVRLWFNEKLEPEYSAISVIKEGAGQPVTTQKARVDKDDPKLLVLELPKIEPGEYTVKYRVLSVDGHTVDYGYTFTIAPSEGVR